MDRLDTYRTLVKDLLECHADRMERYPQPDITTELSFDEARDNYLLLSVGWTKQGRMLVPTIYLRLREGKVWVENDWTEAGVVEELMERGVPEEDVVLAFQRPGLRQQAELMVTA